MNRGNAILLWQESVRETYGGEWGEGQRYSVLGGIALDRDIAMTYYDLDTKQECRKKLAAFLRGWADAIDISWKRCDRLSARQYRRRLLTGSIGLAGEWSEWIDGIPERAEMNYEYEYRRRDESL
mgnify:CR=1 FL=1